MPVRPAPLPRGDAPGGTCRKRPNEPPTAGDETAFLVAAVQPQLEPGWDVELALSEGVVLATVAIR